MYLCSFLYLCHCLNHDKYLCFVFFLFSESFSSQQALESLVSPSPSLNIAEVKKEEKFFGSTDSGIAQEVVEKLSETEEIRTVTPPPPLLEDLPEHVEPPRVVETKKETVEEEAPPVEEFEVEERLIEAIVVPKEFTDAKHVEATDDIDWQYQIPSPPKGFRDRSPGYFNETPKSDCKDSVVTSPELFEKLKTIEDNQCDKETVASDISSVISEEEKPLCNNLSLENLEKRQSLVYNRELTTSLKMSESETVPRRSEAVDSFSRSLSKFESTFIEIQKSSQIKEDHGSKYVRIAPNALPNFKISTYDRPKQKIKVFEDNTVHSNAENFTKSQKSPAKAAAAPALSRSFLGRSMENIAFKPPRDMSSSYFREEKEYKYASREMPKSFGPVTSVFRSESFSSESGWSPTKPVSRSKSQLSLNTIKQRERQSQKSESNMSRSNSLYDVSGLQSLGVSLCIFIRTPWF